MLILNEENLSKLTDYKSLTNEMERAMVMYHTGQYIMPERMHVNFDNNTLLLMPAVAGDQFGTKLISLIPDNPKRMLPVIQGIVILNDRETGLPLALFNGAILTALRTAAVSSAGIRHLTPEHTDSLGLVGTGVQGLQQILCAAENRSLRKIYLFDRLIDRLDPFKACLQPLLPDTQIYIVKSTREILEKTDVLILASNSTEPVLPEDASLLEGKHIIAIGSYKPEMREVPNTFFSMISKCYVDTDLAIDESGDLIDPLSTGELVKEQIVNLGRMIQMEEKVDTSRSTLFKTVGMALFDLVAASWYYKQARRTGIGFEVSF